MTEPLRPFATPADRGPLRFLPALLFEDRRPLVVILAAWAIAFAGSIALGFVITRLVPSGAGPAFGKVSPVVLILMIGLFSPVVETLMMAGLLGLLRRWLAAWQAVVASAAIWGVAHSLMAPLWGAVVWWPFLIFSTVYLARRPRGFWVATAMAASVHILQNAPPAIVAALGY